MHIKIRQVLALPRRAALYLRLEIMNRITRFLGLFNARLSTRLVPDPALERDFFYIHLSRCEPSEEKKRNETVA